MINVNSLNQFIKDAHIGKQQQKNAIKMQSSNSLDNSVCCP